MDKKIKELKEVEVEYLDYFSKLGFCTEKSENLLPENKSAAVLFMICGGIKYDNVFRGNEESNMQQLARIQNCLRTDNDYRVGYSPRHLTNFKMLEVFSFNNTNFSKITDYMIDYLITTGVPPNEIFLNVPDNKKEISENAKRYSSLGIEIRRLDPTKLSWRIKDGPLEGQRMEIGHIPTEWELWNIAYIDPQNRKLVDSGMALERLVAVINGYNSVFEIEKLKKITEKIISNFPYLQKEDAQYVGDHILTLNEASNQGIFPSAKGPGNKIRYLTKKVLARIRASESQTDGLLDLLNPIFEEEIKRIEETYKKCEKEFKDYLQNYCREYFNLENYLNQLKKGTKSGYFDSPKLLNEEYIKIAIEQNKKIILPSVSKKELGQKYDLPLGLIERLKK
ncbi:MAG: alanine--tRNA ligase-related protein [Candidatus Pacearchaeota archaeon]